AMGASSVIATGRNAEVLKDLGRRFGPRLRTVPMAGKEEEDRQRILQAAPGPIDRVLDLLAPAAAPSQARADRAAAPPPARVGRGCDGVTGIGDDASADQD